MIKMHSHLICLCVVVLIIVIVLIYYKKHSREGYYGWRGARPAWNRARALARWSHAYDAPLLYYPYNSVYYYPDYNPEASFYNTKVSQLPENWEKIADLIGANSETNLVTRKDGEGYQEFGYQLPDESIALLPNYVIGSKEVVIDGEKYAVNYLI
jgi:hypothetical protein